MLRTPSRARRAAARARMLVAAGALLCAAAFTAAPQAQASKIKEEFAHFVDCPTATAGVCTWALTTGGEFKMGFKDVPIENPITIQGGLEYIGAVPESLIPARDGNTITSPPQKVPGGLLGIGLLEGIGGEVTATATLAGPASNVIVNQIFVAQGGEGPAVVLPLQIKLDNPLLGESCTIGSEAEPVVLHLRNAKKGTLSAPGKRKILKISGVTLEDDSFAVPAAKNCGLLTPLVNLLAGLPSGAGHNKAVLIGDFEETEAQWAEKWAKPPKPKRK